MLVLLGCDSQGQPISAANEIPPTCGVLLENQRRVVAHTAPRHARQELPFGVWVALDKSTPMAGLNEDEQRIVVVK